MSAVLQLQGIVRRFSRGPLGRRTWITAVDQVDLTVDRGEVVGLIGESGSGKTTLARTAVGLLRPHAGQVTLLDTPVDPRRRSTLRTLRRRCQILFQDPGAHLNPGLRVKEILADSARLHRPAASPAEAAAEALAQVGMAHRAEALPSQLSGGERRRVGIAQVLIADPDLVVADEPTAGLDAARKASIVDLLLASDRGRRAQLLVSHDLALVAYAADRVAVMLAGRIIERVDVAELGRTTHHPYTHRLLQAAGMVAAPATAPRVHVAALGPGCPWVHACDRAVDACATTRPALVDVAPTHAIACLVVAPDPRGAA